MNYYVAAILIIVSLISGCAHREYEKTGTGEFQGVLEVRWLKPDRFLFIPNKSDPLRFTTSNGELIVPKPMYTDGGSIPRILWSFPGYSPWGTAPAFIIHDWMFEAHRCKEPDFENIKFSDSFLVMAETIKTLMETNSIPKDESLFFNIVSAVKSPIAERLWESGECNLPPEGIAYGTVGDMKMVLERESEVTKTKLGVLERKMSVTSDERLRNEYAREVKSLKNRITAIDRISTESIVGRSDYALATQLLFTINLN